MAILDWPATERPREKLLRLGSRSLSDAELLALIFKRGTKDSDAVALARDVLAETGGLSALFELERGSFVQLAGCGDARFAEIAAVVELGKRYLRCRLERGPALTDSSSARDYLVAELRGYPSEVFGCLFLDTQHQVLGFEVLFFGTIDSAAIHPRVVVRRALAHNAASLILAHNHPSGSTQPSAADRTITRRLVEACKLIDVQVLDHVVVAGANAVSLADLGQL